MNKAQAAASPSPGQIERAAQIRELIHAQMYLARIYTGVVEDFAEANDDAGLSYGLEKLGLYVRTALELRFDLEAIKKSSNTPVAGGRG